MATTKRKPDGGAVKATKDDWLKAAVRVLVTEGVNQVMVLPLAAKLKVSRSSFYWYFRNRQDLLDQLLDYWRETNTRSIISHAERPSDTVNAGVLHIFECWLDERLYSPRLDFAVRSWARQSPPVRRLIARADAERLHAIARLFERHGYEPEDALIRARVLYCMQVGYYLLDMKEPVEARLSHIAAYLRTFTGQEPTRAEIGRFRRLTEQRHPRSAGVGAR